MKYDNINSVYEAYKSLGRAQRRQLVADLCAQGIRLRRIEAYTYPEAPGIKHLFFYFEHQKEAVPYFMLEPDIWKTVCDTIGKAINDQ